MTSYRNEQRDGYRRVLEHLEQMGIDGQRKLLAEAAPYLEFRKRTAVFLQDHFAGICTQSCYESRRSACCSRDGIVTFFADLVVNALVSEAPAMARLFDRLARPHQGFKCLYLSADGCLWQVKPIVCEMFLCDPAQSRVFDEKPDLKQAWAALVMEKKRYTWPDRPVLFDRIEAVFRDAGIDSPLMYLHNSPGLLRVKQQAGLVP